MAREAKGKDPWWAKLPRERLLDVRLCDLKLTIEGTWLEGPLDAVRADLARKGLERLKPHFWLSEEWFCPDQVTGIAIPFYLAHPRLMRLERREMLEVEGGTRGHALKLLRHELGHALDHAFGLHRRKRWKQLFGRSSQRYPDAYRPNPASKHYVQHLDDWYAQAHPDEDFAETFAVWLTPRSQWRRRYQGWPALAKLEYVDELMGELEGQPPRYRSRKRVDSLPQLRFTLRDYYARKQARFLVGYPSVYDRDLKQIFSSDPAPNAPTAAVFLRRNRNQIRRIVAKWTGEYEFTLDHVFRLMIGRCKELKLRAVGDPDQMRLDFAILLTVKAMHHLYEREWIPM
ncbi:MAG: putative zinc-binding metallopeptidase [Planctomycetes bacterium]|nr:putative zinc-binding metallopeptidase [Planctomycetota bacterium]